MITLNCIYRQGSGIRYEIAQSRSQPRQYRPVRDTRPLRIRRRFWEERRYGAVAYTKAFYEREAA